MNMLDQSLGQLARQIPGATRILDQHHLDFCCGGRHSLREAAAQAGLDANAIAAELSALQARAQASTDGPDWSQATAPELLSHILNRYHAVHREQLPELIRLARRVEQVHGERESCPRGLADHLHAMQQELESHMRKEEMILFPLIEQGQGPMATGPITVMRHEHDDHGVALRKLEDLTQGITTPAGACGTWRALYTGLRAFREDLMTHIHLENNLLFERYAPVAGA